MKRIAIGLVIGMLGGGFGGFAVGIFVYPYWFLNDVATETLSSEIQRTERATGKFIQANKSDPVHWGKGKITLYQEPNKRTVVFLHDDFAVGPGPRFHVYLVDHANVRKKKDFVESGKVDLGRLRAFEGSQVYAVPPSVDVAKYKSVVIWCKEFGVLISPATLAPRQSANQSAETGKQG